LATLAYAYERRHNRGPATGHQQLDAQFFDVSTSNATGGSALERRSTSVPVGVADPSPVLVLESCAGIGGGPTHVLVDWWIVAELIVNEATAAKHVEHILHKQGFKSRVEIATG